MQSFVPDPQEYTPEFVDPLYLNLWDCFKKENLDTVHAKLKGNAKGLNSYYEEVKYELQEFSLASLE